MKRAPSRLSKLFTFSTPLFPVRLRPDARVVTVRDRYGDGEDWYRVVRTNGKGIAQFYGPFGKAFARDLARKIRKDMPAAEVNRLRDEAVNRFQWAVSR